MAVTRSKGFWTTFLLSFFILALVSVAVATENGGLSYPAGVETVMPAVDPAPHAYLFQGFTLFYSASRFNDGHGNSAIPGFRVTEFANCMKLKYNWDKKFLGGNLMSGAGLVLGYAQIQEGGPSQANTNLANQDLEPIFVVYNRENLHFHYGLDIWTPGLAYRRGDLVNIGMHYWEYEPNFAFTWMPNHGKTEVSSRFHYALDTTDPDTNYHSGNQISWEFNATQNVSKKVAMGFQGYLLKQVTDDSVKGVTVGYNGNRTQLLGLGPQVRVAVPGGVLAFKYFHETEVRYHPAGDAFWFEFGIPFKIGRK